MVSRLYDETYFPNSVKKLIDRVQNNMFILYYLAIFRNIQAEDFFEALLHLFDECRVVGQVLYGGPIPAELFRDEGGIKGGWTLVLGAGAILEQPGQEEQAADEEKSRRGRPKEHCLWRGLLLTLLPTLPEEGVPLAL